MDPGSGPGRRVPDPGISLRFDGCDDETGGVGPRLRPGWPPLAAGCWMAEGTRFDTHVTAERFQLLINAVTDYAIYMLDADGYVATWNPGARRFKGYEAEEIIGRHFSTFFTEEDREAGIP